MLKLILSNPVRLIQFIGIVLFLLFVVTQLAWPLITNSALFPLFSRKPRLKKEIAEVNEALEEEKLAEDLEQRRASLEYKRSRRTAQKSAETQQTTQTNTKTRRNTVNKN